MHQNPADYNDMIYVGTPKEIETRRKSFIRKWRLKCRAVADSLEEAGDRLFTFSRLPDSQWRSARTTNAIERLHEEFKRRIKTQTVLPSAETAAMLFWAALARLSTPRAEKRLAALPGTTDLVGRRSLPGGRRMHARRARFAGNHSGVMHLASLRRHTDIRIVRIDTCTGVRAVRPTFRHNGITQGRMDDLSIEAALKAVSPLITPMETV